MAGPIFDYWTVAADRIVVTAGTLEANLTMNGKGSRIFLDGKPLRVRRMTIEFDVRAVPKVTLDVLPWPVVQPVIRDDSYIDVPLIKDFPPG